MNNLEKADQLVQEGLVHHQKNEIHLALPFYQKALNLNSTQAGAHNLSADIYFRLGENLKALSHANLANANVRDAHFLNTRAMIFIGMKKYEEALADLRLALKIDANIPEVYNNLCIVYRHSKDYKKALTHAQSALELRPNFIQAMINLSAIKQDQGLYDDCEKILKEVLALDSDNPMARISLAKVLYLSKKHDQAILISQEAINRGPVEIEIYLMLAHMLIQSEQLKEAAHILLKGYQSSLDKAFNELDSVLSQDIFFKVLYDCCQYLAGMEGNIAAAVLLYEKSAQFAPSVACSCLINLSSLYFQLHRMHEAIEYCEKALRIEPRQVWGHNNIGVCYISLGESEKAIASFKKALEIQPDFAPALGWLLKEKGHICDWDDYDSVRSAVSALRLTNNNFAIAPFTALAVYDDPQELLYWAQLTSKDLFNFKAPIAAFNQVRSTNDQPRKMRIGYYSFDFRNHPVAHLTARLFETHDQESFEIYAYSYGPDDGSHVRERIKKAVKSFVDVKELSLIDTAKRIADDQLDVLIDLTGNTLHTRSQVFAFRPAPIQAHWLGFVGTMGSEYYDYIIADEIVIPSGDEAYFSEKILRLPHGMHIMDDSRIIKSSHQTRAANGLPEEGVIFGCFCQTFKIQPEIFSAWVEILKLVPKSVLWLAGGPKGAIENLRMSAQKLGLDPDRIIVAERCSVEEYLSRFTLIDLYLDTFPYTSGTVASDALYSGCPLLTLSGKTMVSRMAGSILKHAEMSELVTYSIEDYIKKAVSLGENTTELARIKQSLLKQRMDGSILNTRQSAQDLESIFQKKTIENP